MANCKELQEDGGWWEDLLVNRCTFPIAPVNTFTNLAYILAGLVTWLHFQNAASFVWGLTMVFLGVSSGYYHGFKNRLGGKLDDNGMYAAFTALLVYSLNPHSPLVAWVMTLVTAAVLWRIGFGPSGAALVHTYLGMAIAVIVLKLILTGAVVCGLVSLGIFGLGYAIWWQDLQKTFKWPRWGHGAWHLLTALAMTLLFWGAR